MAAFGTGGSRAQVRGPSPGFRFTLYAILSIVVMFLDQRHGWLEQARFVLQGAAYPIQLAVSSPSAAWKWLHESFETRDALRAENQRLQKQQRELELRTMRYEALARENGELRGLRDALPPVAQRWLAAEIVNIQLNSLRQRVLINRGTTNGVFKAQAVLDDKGLIGQTTHVGPWSAEVILITDPEHAVPVAIQRTGLRTIAVGAGDAASLALPYLPGNADIKTGDMLVTSGLGGVFPAGYPVARVTEVHRDAVQPLAQVRAIPFARIDTDTEVVLVWFRPEHPAAPAPASATGDLKVGNAALQPQPAPPPRPKPAVPDATRTPAPPVPTPGSPASPPAAPVSTPASPAPSAGRPPAPPNTSNSTAPAPSKKGTPAPAAAPAGVAPKGALSAPTNSKEPAAGDAAPTVAPKRPNSPTPAPPDATPRNP
ncbi:MAG: Rod shape-determining protein MreC [Gammaproteobacteria bacterium]|nr:Rod shape-determining protein MreC [Gammaproteobacteria bacterium]